QARQFVNHGHILVD
ncbi:hypothetical protein MK382_00330, partial [Streptococcus pneumoniae]|nr:hypothetical protein [Streptococcus pneumoniae]